MKLPQEYFKTIIQHLPQIEPLLFVMPFEIRTDDQWQKKTPKTAFACKNGFYFHVDFWNSLPDNKRCGIILHEIMHCALQHLSDPYRDLSITPKSFDKLSNMAQDVVIELAIAELCMTIQPSRQMEHKSIVPISDHEHHVHVQEFKGMSWRSIYSILRSRATGAFPEIDGHERYENDDDPKIREKWEEAVVDMQSIEKNLVGSSLGNLAIRVDLDTANVPWQTLLGQYLTSNRAEIRKSWARVKRRPFSTKAEYRPVNSGSVNNIDQLNLLLDTSGSMSNDYNKIAAEVLSVCNIASSIFRCDYDADVAYTEMITDPDEYTISHLYGGGGTSLRRTLMSLKQNEEFNPSMICVVLTDGGDDYDVADLGVNCVFVNYGTHFRSNAGPVFSI
jgi:predicted metal-dependent peptidase